MHLLEPQHRQYGFFRAPALARLLTIGLLSVAAGALALAPAQVAGQPASPAADAAKASDTPKPEPKRAQAQAVGPEVKSEVEASAAAKREKLLADAQTALAETNRALQALDVGKQADALAALERATGKLDLILARDPRLALAPVGVSTIVRDLYAGPNTARQAVSQAEKLLDAGQVQQARTLLQGLASEAEIQVTNIPLATYPAAIKAVAPLIDAGKVDQAKSALTAALNTLVVESYVMPLPPIRAKAILENAETLAEKSERTDADSKRLREQLEAARNELKLGEVLGYGSKDDYQSLYAQIDQIEKKTEGGKSGRGFFDKIKQLLKEF